MPGAKDRSAALLTRLSARGGLAGDSVEDMTVVVASSPRDVLHALSAWLDHSVGDAVTSIDSAE